MDELAPLATMNCEADAYFMRQALAEAMEARQRAEVPVGALIVKDGLPVNATVDRVKNSTRCCTGVINVSIARDTHDCTDTVAHGSDMSVLHGVEGSGFQFRQGLCVGRGG